MTVSRNPKDTGLTPYYLLVGTMFLIVFEIAATPSPSFQSPVDLAPKLRPAPEVPDQWCAYSRYRPAPPIETHRVEGQNGELASRFDHQIGKNTILREEPL